MRLTPNVVCRTSSLWMGIRPMNSTSVGPSTSSDSDSLRWLVLVILLASAAMQLGRLIQVQSTTGEVPFLSANDRSRWCTIAALAVNGSYEIDDVIEIRDPKTKRRTWYTIDLVRHRGTDGRQHYYSSKPPLLPTLYAGVYGAIRGLTGATLMSDPFFVARSMLFIVNLAPLVAFWCFLLAWFRREQLDRWALLILAFFVAWGTYLSTFVNTLNNHLPAALAVGVSLWCIDRVLLKSDKRARWFALCGLCTSFGAANELPALSWVAAAGALLLFADIKWTVLAYVPALLPVGLAFFGLNYAAHHEFAPAYAHRSVGDHMLDIELSSPPAANATVVQEVVTELRAQDIQCSDESQIRQARKADTWELWDPSSQTRLALRSDDGLTPSPNEQVVDAYRVGVYEWGDWYDYPGSYWTEDRKQGVDKGEPNRAVYIFHCLLGHHGIFSLTPFWLVALAGAVVVFYTAESWNLLRNPSLLLAAAIMSTSLVVIGFYFSRGLEDRNYGGVSSGFRWSFWLIPLWLWLAVQALRETRSPWLRRIVEGLLIVSLFSACYPWRNPWTSPWLMQWMEYAGWL